MCECVAILTEKDTHICHLNSVLFLCLLIHSRINISFPPPPQLDELRSETFNEDSFDEWALEAKAPAIPASLNLYRELQQLGFKIVLLTGRSEPFRNATAENLKFAGYDNWERLILRYTYTF